MAQSGLLAPKMTGESYSGGRKWRTVLNAIAALESGILKYRCENGWKMAETNDVCTYVWVQKTVYAWKMLFGTKINMHEHLQKSDCVGKGENILEQLK